MQAKFLLFCSLFFSTICAAQTRAYIDKETKEFELRAHIRSNHKIFGYAHPLTSSQKLILFSVFTNDVKNNPHKCSLGAYYDTYGLKDGDKILYERTEGKFYKMKYIPLEGPPTYFYFEKRYVVMR